MKTASKPQNTTERVVVLLKPSEKKRLAQLAGAEQVSAAEILRRSLHAYSGGDKAEEDQLIVELNQALDKTLETIRSTRRNIENALDRIDRQKPVAA